MTASRKLASMALVVRDYDEDLPHLRKHSVRLPKTRRATKRMAT